MPGPKPLPPSYLFIALLLMPVVHFLIPVWHIIPFPVSLVGVIPIAVGVFLNFAADAQLKRHQTTVKPFEDSAELVTTGLYAGTRHPMYLGFVLILLGVAVLFGSVGPFVIVAVFPVVMEVAFIRTEERMLSARFGEQWLAYRAKVRRWI
jgi:protein-S-isoprenylcysteine O-methyltransferase Ste14